MKEKIQELIFHHKTAKQELELLLEEFSQIDTTKLNYQEEDALKEGKIRYEEESAWRAVFISSLEGLL